MDPMGQRGGITNRCESLSLLLLRLLNAFLPQVVHQRPLPLAFLDGLGGSRLDERPPEHDVFLLQGLENLSVDRDIRPTPLEGRLVDGRSEGSAAGLLHGPAAASFPLRLLATPVAPLSSIQRSAHAEEKKGSPSSQSVFGLRDHILKREELCRRKGDGGVGGGKLGASPRRPDLVLVDGAGVLPLLAPVRWHGSPPEFTEFGVPRLLLLIG